MRIEDVLVGEQVVHDSMYNGGEYAFYEISEIDDDCVTLQELAYEAGVRRIPETKKWKIKYIDVRSKWIDSMDVSMSKLTSEFDVYNPSKKYSVVLNENPGYSYLEYDSDTDSKTNEITEGRYIGKTYLRKGDIYMVSINQYIAFWLIKTLTTESSGKLEVDKLQIVYESRYIINPKDKTSRRLSTVACKPYAVVDIGEFSLDILDQYISSGKWVKYDPSDLYLNPRDHQDINSL